MRARRNAFSARTDTPWRAALVRCKRVATATAALALSLRATRPKRARHNAFSGRTATAWRAAFKRTARGLGHPAHNLH